MSDNHIIIYGSPGAGKGTQARRLVEKYGFFHVETGKIIRDEINNGTPLGKSMTDFINNGRLVPDSHTIGLVHDIINRNSDKAFLFDGFPRTVIQAIVLNGILNKNKNYKKCILVGLEVDEAELKRRILARGMDANDMDPVVTQNRITVFNCETTPVKEFYSRRDLYYAVDGTRSEDDVFAELCNFINKIK